MQNEILKPVLDTDEVAVPRYDIVGPNGSVIQQNVELRLKNEVVQEGTPMSKASILDDNAEMDIWGTIGDRTPNDAFSFIGKGLVAHDKDIANLAETLEGKIVTGTYTGNGKRGDGKKAKTISIGAQPKAVFVRGTRTNYSDGSPHHDVAMCLYGTPLTTSGGTKALEATSNGFIATYIEGEADGASPSINESGYVYMYVVIF